MSLLTIKNLSFTYTDGKKKIPTLSSIDISVNTGEFVCIIGPNGSGKSTLLKIIAGILSPLTGTVKCPTESSYLPQGALLLPWRTIEDNLYLPFDIKKIPRGQDKIKKILKQFDLNQFAKMYPHQLSGGMQQKAAIARTMIHNSSFILLDEPFSALDAITKLKQQKWLKELIKSTRSTVICVTHDIQEAIYLGDIIYVMSSRPGKIVKKIIVSKYEPKNLEKKLIELLVN